MLNIFHQEVCQKMKRMRVDDLTWIKEMVWSEKEAAQFQVNQIGVSACGATAVINTLVRVKFFNFLSSFYFILKVFYCE